MTLLLMATDLLSLHRHCLEFGHASQQVLRDEPVCSLLRPACGLECAAHTVRTTAIITAAATITTAISTTTNMRL